MLNGMFYLKDAGLHIDYTNVTYIIKNNEDNSTVVPVKFTPDSISIPSFKAIDKNGNIGIGTVHFIHKKFSTFDIGIDLTANNLFALNTNSIQNSRY